MSAATKAGTAQARSRRGVPQAGEVVAGKYEVQDVIGAGGMGVVVSARHIELGQTVAIKFLDKSLVDQPSASARFFREARAASRIRSEHVTRVLDVARTETGVPYRVMEHLVGMDLAEIQRTQGPLPIDAVLDYVLQAGEALAEAHAAGVIHRDLKPGNLFLTHRADGSPLVKVLDFGISKILEPGSDDSHDGAQTAESDILGSTWYMSPEQVRSSKSVDARTDVWSLGVILFQLLTGIHAFRAESMSACLAKIVTDPPPPLRAARPEVPEGLESVILACLEKDPDRRLQSVAELATALAPFAPEHTRLSIERISRVHGSNPSGSHTPAPTTGRVSGPITPPPSGSSRSPAAGRTAAQSELTPPVDAGQSTGASVSTTATPLPARAAPRWAFALAALAAFGVGGVAAQRLLITPPPAVSAVAAATVTTTTAVALVASAAATVPETSVVPMATATAQASASATSSAATSATPPATSPTPAKQLAPAVPRPKPGKVKITGPGETTF